jgi:sugar lactone lactonase YvrE
MKRHRVNPAPRALRRRERPHVAGRRTLAVLATTLALLVVAAAGAAVKGTPGGPNGPQIVTTFAKGAFPESLAVDGSGNLYVSIGFTGQVVKVSTTGEQTTIAVIRVGNGLLTGLAFDASGRLYVAAATFSDDPASGVFRINADRSVTRVLTLPVDSFPNGLAFHNGVLYVSDSDLGTIWQGINGTAHAWFQDSLLAPTRKIGANGIAFWRNSLYVAVADAGRIVRIPLEADGTAGAATVVSEQQALRSADGIAFDVTGNLYVAVNDTNRLYRLAPDESLVRLADRSDGLSYPTMPAFGTTRAAQTTLYLTNGALANGTPDIQVFDIGVRGLPLP